MGATGRVSSLVSGREGFSLIEAMISAGLLVTALVTLVQTFVLAIRSNLDARDTTYGTVLAAEKIEELHASSSDPFDGASIEQVDSYTRQWTIAPLPANPDEAVVITVTVSPRGRAGAAGQVRLTTIQSRRLP